jgi:uncharacterized membrane protein YfcA
MGLILGLIGGGGSILAVPLLVFLFGLPGSVATFYSLLIVAVSAAVGALPFARRGLVEFKTGLLFLFPSILGVSFARRVLLPSLPGTPEFKDTLILMAFAALMIAAARSMLRKAPVSAGDAERPASSPARVALSGIGVGIVTGFVGAGGGFIIVPVLVNQLRVPMERAVGTSLFIIAVNSVMGFGGDWLAGASVDWTLIIRFTSIALLGVVAGTRLNRSIPVQTLKPAFGWFVLTLGSLMLVLNLLGFSATSR